MILQEVSTWILPLMAGSGPPEPWRSSWLVRRIAVRNQSFKSCKTQLHKFWFRKPNKASKKKKYEI